jgi:hypothetical protein
MWNTGKEGKTKIETSHSNLQIQFVGLEKK